MYAFNPLSFTVTHMVLPQSNVSSEPIIRCHKLLVYTFLCNKVKNPFTHLYYNNVYNNKGNSLVKFQKKAIIFTTILR